MSRVHWLGTGLSSIPGLRKLLKKGYETFVWNRTVEKAQNLLGDLTNNIYKFDFNELEKQTKSGDVLISMLPALKTGFSIIDPTAIILDCGGLIIA